MSRSLGYIYIIDRQTCYLTGLSRASEMVGLTPICVTSPEEALGNGQLAIVNYPIKVVLVAMRFGNSTSEQFIRYAANKLSLTVIGMSERPEAEEWMRLAGCRFFIPKPVAYGTFPHILHEIGC